LFFLSLDQYFDLFKIIGLIFNQLAALFYLALVQRAEAESQVLTRLLESENLVSAVTVCHYAVDTEGPQALFAKGFDQSGAMRLTVPVVLGSAEHRLA
jgi:hypothetical protein